MFMKSPWTNIFTFELPRLLSRSLSFCGAVVLAIPAVARRKTDRYATRKEKQELIAGLQSDSPPAEKAITCKLLAIHGSSEAVPDLAELLPDPQLSSWARIALEAIPGPAADREPYGKRPGRSMDSCWLVRSTR